MQSKIMTVYKEKRTSDSTQGCYLNKIKVKATSKIAQFKHDNGIFAVV